jgi:spore coat protein U-like protein
MKKILALLSLLALILVFAGTAGSTEYVTGTIQVTATTIGYCTVSASALDFGHVTGLTYTSANTSITVHCSNQLPYNVAIDHGLHDTNSSGVRHLMSGDGLYFIEYHLTPYPGTEWGDFCGINTMNGQPCVPGTGNGSDQILPVTGYSQEFQNIPIGTVLNDTATVTVIY